MSRYFSEADLATIGAEMSHRARCLARYDREIADAKARGWEQTAKQIEAERVEYERTKG